MNVIAKLEHKHASKPQSNALAITQQGLPQLNFYKNIFISSEKNVNKFCSFLNSNSFCPVGWDSRINRLLLCRGVRPPHEYPGYDTKQSDGEVPAMLEL